MSHMKICKQVGLSVHRGSASEARDGTRTCIRESLEALSVALSLVLRSVWEAIRVGTKRFALVRILSSAWRAKSRAISETATAIERRLLLMCVP